MHIYAPMAEQRARILAGIRSGGFPHVAAEAFGMKAAELEACLVSATREDASEDVRRFAHDVAEAHAQARLRAEICVFEDDPKVWLEHGPGRETAHRLGWATSVKPRAAPLHDANALANLALMHAIHTVLPWIPEPARESFTKSFTKEIREKTKVSPHLFKETPNDDDSE